MKRILRTFFCNSVGVLAFLLFVWGALYQSALAQDATFSTTTLQIEGKLAATEMIVEIARSPAQLAQGLMYRNHLPENRGMLFDFGEEKKIYMWMKNTILPLDMIFLDRRGEVVGVKPKTTPFSEAIITIEPKARFVLEVNAGTSAKLGIEPGDRLNHTIFD